MLDVFYVLVNCMILGFQIFLFFLYLDAFFERKFKSPFSVLLIGLVLYCAYLAASLFIQNLWMLLGFGVVILSSGCVFLYKGAFIQKVFFASLFFAIINALDEAALLLISRLMVGDVSVWLSNANNEIVYKTSINIVYFVVILLVRRLWLRHKNSLLLQTKDIAALLIFPLLSIVALLEMNTWYFANDTAYRSRIAIYATILLVTNILMFWFVSNAGKRRQAEKANALLAQQIEFTEQELEALTEAQRKLRYQAHDHKNHLQAISTMVGTGEPADAVNGYIATLCDSLEAAMRVIETGNRYVDAILNYKYYEIQQAGISTSFAISGLGQCNALNPSEWVILLGNTLDNALRAAKESGSAGSIDITLRYEDGNLAYIIRNTVKPGTKAISFEKTTKPNPHSLHGNGLKSVYEVVTNQGGTYDIGFDGRYVTFMATL